MQGTPVRFFVALVVTLLLGAACSPSSQGDQATASQPDPDTTASVLAESPATTAALPAPAEAATAGPEPDAAVPTPTAPVPTPSPASPTPVPTLVPADNPAIAAPLRSGSFCEVFSQPSGAEESTVQASFIIPESMWSNDCSIIDFAEGVGADPERCCGSRLSIGATSDTMTTMLSSWETAEDAILIDAEWTIIDTRSAWILEARITPHTRQEDPWTRRMLLVDIPSGTLIATAHEGPDDVDQERTWAAFEELVASVRVRIPQGSQPEGWNAPPDRWCAGPRWVFEVPPSWFAHDSCDGTSDSMNLNTTDVVAQCACFGPLWIEPGWTDLELDDTVTVLSDTSYTSTTHTYGTAVRIVDIVREDQATGPLELRGVIVDLGDTAVTVVANRLPDYSGPLHSWDATLDAQQLVVDSLREWRESICANPTPGIVHTTTSAELKTAWDSDSVVATIPSGTALAATGCALFAPDGGTWHEVQTVPVVDTTRRVQPRSERGGNYVGWIAGDSFVGYIASPCQANAEDFDPSEWEVAARGDFDGDGASDTALLRGTEFASAGHLRGDERRALPAAEAAFLFADGSATVGPLDDADGRLLAVTDFIQVTRPVGLGRDVLYVADPFERGAYTSATFIIGVDGCVPVVHGRVMEGASAGRQLSYCRASTPFGTILRSLQTTVGVHGVMAGVTDEHFVWVDGDMQPLDGFVSGTEPLCGERFDPAGEFFGGAEYAGAPGPLHGVHGLSLQWLGTDAAEWGEIEFITIGPDRYRVSGRQGAGFGEEGDFLSIGGFVQQLPDGDLKFEGMISSEVSYLNDGQKCSRSGNQTFRSTQGRQFWRMQDQLNCDFISSDYIDIYF